MKGKKGGWKGGEGDWTRFVDAHIHLSDEEYAGDIDEIIAESRNAGVVALVSNSVNYETSIGSLEIAERYSGMVYAALGIHPWNVQEVTADSLKRVKELILSSKNSEVLVAIGEIGLDRKYTRIWRRQLEVFREMLNLAEKLELPVIIHSRDTSADIVEMLPSFNLKKVLLHWFSRPISILDRVVELGYCITEGPLTAYSKSIREVVKYVPLRKLLTETDGPVRFYGRPFEGRRTTPAFVPTVVKAIAEIKKLDVIDVAAQISKNFEEFFGVKLN